MSEGEKEVSEEEKKGDKEELDKLGVSSTFNILSNKDKKDKKDEEKPAYRGFQ